ncbi:carbon monoxide dehydrogenase subunit G [Brevibacillus agri]|uniref:SRPBCC family protein n=1 Tax=Brevibacillus agri TaxID=51101 RepID=UPI002E20AC00|nr:carbon monoxide dehydrogenase subunit G [Brevibacillus agri]MED1657209.1 carbon monoxide dehydrogenase subunit G [Brevibacillus agri]MED1689626.1 carbon monoxide dehydrogenase subunit G [Brevibacillus agri]MED1693912.1 carbon monoxide dehydrogenase subunit G [Brevibacillus agri]MED1698288.1 carbon monoxide dehydrogenase subunit G [Brevibacillus agri]
MNGNGSVELNASIEQVWAKILNPEVLSQCIMGCKELVLIEDGKYRADLAVGIAAVKGIYDATIQLADVQELKSYKLVVRGEGAPGFVEAEGLIELTSVEGGGTTLSYSYNAEVGGKVAAIGQRMLGGVAKLLISDFFKKLKKEIENEQKSA